MRAVRSSRAWTTLEVRRLRELWGVCESVERVAEALGRTMASTRDKARHIGLPRKADRANERERWSRQDEQALIAMWGRGVPMDKAARALGRSERATRRRLAELRAAMRERD